MTHHRGFAALLLASLCGLAGCGDALIYGERSSFNLAIGVNDNAALPLSVNAGLDRTVVNFAPPLGGDVVSGGGGIARGEAVSSISNFDLRDKDRATNALGGTLTVKTQFASGEAAVIIATKHPALAAAIMKGQFVKDTPTQVKLEKYLGQPRDLGRVGAFRVCNEHRNPTLKNEAVGRLLHVDTFEAARANIVQCLGL